MADAPVQRRGRPGWLYPLVAVAIVVVLLIAAAGAYFVNATVTGGADHQRATATLESGRKHNNQIHDTLTNNKLPGALSPSDDVAKAKQEVADFQSSLQEASTTLDDDLHSLTDVDSRLKQDATSIWLIPEKQQLARDRERVEGMISAFSSAKSAFGILHGQMTAYEALLDVIAQFDTINTFLDKGDFSGALGAFGQLDQKMQALLTAAGGKNIPPQMGVFVTALKTLVDDLKKFVQAAQAGDVGTVQSLSAKIESEAKGLGNFDTTAMDTYEDNLLKPYKDAYEGGMKKAGFTVTG